jgi:hypothetical protein
MEAKVMSCGNFVGMRFLDFPFSLPAFTIPFTEKLTVGIILEFDSVNGFSKKFLMIFS